MDKANFDILYGFNYPEKRSLLTPLSPSRWHGKHTYLSSLGMLGSTQLNSILFADHITFNNGYMKHAHTRQRFSNNNNNNKRNMFDTSDNPGLPSYATTVTLKFKLK